jgi:DNA mismatch repair protein MutS
MTPMMQQYLEIKNQYSDFILMYRLGDFYEMFFDDAKAASKALGIALTARDCGEPERAPMCGVPFHSCDPYIKKLVEKGYKVAICEQMEDPSAAKGIVRREVVRIITPGTLTDGDMMNGESSNYLCTVVSFDSEAAISFCDISTGCIYSTFCRDLSPDEVNSQLINELAAFMPTEILVNKIPVANTAVLDFAKVSLKSLVNDTEIPLFDSLDESLIFSRHPICYSTLNVYGSDALNKSVAFLIAYLCQTQKKEEIQIKELKVYSENSYLSLDASSRRSLEITRNMRTFDKKGSLLGVLDRTKSSVGARLLRNFLEKPLLNPAQIRSRQLAVSDFVNNTMMRDDVRRIISDTQDLERLLTKILYSNPNAKDLRAVQTTLRALLSLAEIIVPDKSDILAKICQMCTEDTITEVRALAEYIDSAIVEQPPHSVRDGGMIKEGFNADVDELNTIIKEGASYISSIEAAEKELTGIKTLKISYNKVFGYYIEVSKAQSALVPERYIRKQTLVNGERYITGELKEMESKILGARERITALEFSLFSEIVQIVAQHEELIRKCSAIIANLDVFASLADVACSNNYICPEVDNSDVIDIVDSRHPVVEKYIDTFFVPNDFHMDNRDNRVMLITGPNMAGKSTYMRQLALIVIMAQAGSFVPAKSARIGIVDKIFTRVGASDDLASGQSTFMLEMTEVAYILNNATSKSLILYDEIGRGTSTFDGMSIAKAVLEYTASKKIGAKTLFATHYHELASMEGQIDGIKNYNVAAKKKQDTVVFLRKILRGSADDSYGIEVAQLAGVVPEVIKKAKANLAQLEKSHIELGTKNSDISTEAQEEFENITFEDISNDVLVERLKKIDVNALTPYECMTELYELVKIANNN